MLAVFKAELLPPALAAADNPAKLLSDGIGPFVVWAALLEEVPAVPLVGARCAEAAGASNLLLPMPKLSVTLDDV